MIRPWIVALLVALGVSTAARAEADEGGRTVLVRGVFSYEASAGWHVSDLNAAYPVAQGPAKEGFVPNIHVDVVASALPLESFVSDNLRAARSAPDFRQVSGGPFFTDAGLDGIRVVVTVTVGSTGLRQTFYFFDAGAGRKIVVCASCLAKDGAVEAPVFDASLRTLSLE